MRKEITTALSTVILLGLGARAAVADGQKRYEIKNGSVEMTNSMMRGAITTLYFDDFGDKSASVTRTSTTMMGQTVDAETWTVHAGGYTIRYDARKKMGTRTKQIGHAAAAASAGMDAEKLAANAQATKKELPARTVAGKSCRGVQVSALAMTIRTWTWKGLPLYSETFMGALDKPPIVVQATKVDESAPPPSVFTVPADVKLTER
jgi:hypothetical protein